MSFNTTTASGTNASAINKAQQKIAALEDSALEQDEMRDALSQMKALLGAMRIRAKELIQEQLENKRARADKNLQNIAITVA